MLRQLGVVQWSGKELLPCGGDSSRLYGVGSSRPKGRKHYARCCFRPLMTYSRKLLWLKGTKQKVMHLTSRMSGFGNIMNRGNTF